MRHSGGGETTLHFDFATKARMRYFRRLTFEVTGRTQPAKPAVDCPVERGVSQRPYGKLHLNARRSTAAYLAAKAPTGPQRALHTIGLRCLKDNGSNAEHRFLGQGPSVFGGYSPRPDAALVRRPPTDGRPAQALASSGRAERESALVVVSFATKLTSDGSAVRSRGPARLEARRTSIQANRGHGDPKFAFGFVRRGWLDRMAFE